LLKQVKIPEHVVKRKGKTGGQEYSMYGGSNFLRDFFSFAYFLVRKPVIEEGKSQRPSAYPGQHHCYYVNQPVFSPSIF
jgi:hypothetical protein